MTDFVDIEDQDAQTERVLSNFVMGYTNVPVIVRPKAE